MNFNSSSSFFGGQSYKNEKEKSGRSLDIIDEEKEMTFEEIQKKFSDEIIFKVIKKSIFKFHTEKKGKETFISYDEIKIGDKEEEINNIDEIKNFSSSEKILKDNYKKFKICLEEIENKIKYEFIHEYTLTITLQFETNSSKSNSFITNCSYIIEIPGEESINYKDADILLNGLKQGLPFLINEINNDAYKELK